MALLDSMESILDSLRDSLDPSESNSGNPREEQPASYREALAHYRTELLEHLADDRGVVVATRPQLVDALRSARGRHSGEEPAGGLGVEEERVRGVDERLLLVCEGATETEVGGLQ